MPYITQEARDELAKGHFSEDSPPGELNYVLSKVAAKYLDAKGLSYWTLNDIIGAFEAAKLEFYRRIVVPYEEQKLIQNGDVYD